MSGGNSPPRRAARLARSLPCAGSTTDKGGRIRMIKVRWLLFGLLAPVLVIAMAAPLVLGHVAVRLLLTRMRRAPRDLPPAAPAPAAAAPTTPALLSASCDV